MFKKFPSLTRFSHDWTITEKIDGSNGQIIIDNLSSSDDAMYRDKALAQIGEYYIFAGSRNKLLGLGKDNDNFGLAQWVQNNAPVLVETLGEGRHYGEWCGNGIQRNYGLSKKLFALFNTHRWGGGVELPESIGLTVVPVLAEGYMQDPGKEAAEQMQEMLEFGSVFSPGFMKPEGVVMRHNPSGTVFKKTYDYDEQGKWVENQTRKTEKLGCENKA